MASDHPEQNENDQENTEQNADLQQIEDQIQVGWWKTWLTFILVEITCKSNCKTMIYSRFEYDTMLCYNFTRHLYQGHFFPNQYFKMLIKMVFF